MSNIMKGLKKTIAKEMSERGLRANEGKKICHSNATRRHVNF